MKSPGRSRSDMLATLSSGPAYGPTLSVDALSDRDELYPHSEEEMAAVRKATCRSGLDRMQPALSRLRCRNMYAALAAPDAHGWPGGQTRT
jgi:hypothetical protein